MATSKIIWPSDKTFIKIIPAVLEKEDCVIILYDNKNKQEKGSERE